MDEIGYLKLQVNAANVLFQVANERYLARKPLVFTTNKPLAAWGHMLHDPDLAEAILDRVLEHGRHIQLRGPSYRTRHHRNHEKNSTQSNEAPGARISGTHTFRQDVSEGEDDYLEKHLDPERAGRGGSGWGGLA